MGDERERFYSRLATIPELRPMPSIGNWILVEVERPGDLARKLNRRMAPGLVSVPRHVPGAVRIPVRHPKDNETLIQVLRDVCSVKRTETDALLEDDAKLDAG